jgi:hypothetical protein
MFIDLREGEGESIEDRFKALYDDRFDYCLHIYYDYIINCTPFGWWFSMLEVFWDFHMYRLSLEYQGVINYM